MLIVFADTSSGAELSHRGPQTRGDQADQEKHQKHYEKHLGDPGRRTRERAEAQRGRNQCDDQECESPTQHATPDLSEALRQRQETILYAVENSSDQNAIAVPMKLALRIEIAPESATSHSR